MCPGSRKQMQFPHSHLPNFFLTKYYIILFFIRFFSSSLFACSESCASPQEEQIYRSSNRSWQGVRPLRGAKPVSDIRAGTGQAGHMLSCWGYNHWEGI